MSFFFVGADINNTPTIVVTCSLNKFSGKHKLKATGKIVVSRAPVEWKFSSYAVGMLMLLVVLG